MYVHVGAVGGYCTPGMSKVCAGCDLVSDQCVWKCFSRPSQPGKLQLLCLVESCSTCAIGYCKLRSGNFRISRHALCSEALSLDFGTAAVPAVAELLIFSARHVPSCFCCSCVCIGAASTRLVTAGRGEPWHAQAEVPETVILTVTYVQ